MYQLGSNIDIEHTHTPEEETHYGDHSPGDSEKTVRQYRKTGKYKKKTEKMTQDVKDIENTTAKATKKTTSPRIKLQEVILDFSPEGQYMYALDFTFRSNTSRNLALDIEKKDWRRVSRPFLRAFKRALNRLLGENEKMTFQFGVQYIGANNKGGSTLSHDGLEYSRSQKKNSFSTMWEDVELDSFYKYSDCEIYGWYF